MAFATATAQEKSDRERSRDRGQNIERPETAEARNDVENTSTLRHFTNRNNSYVEPANVSTPDFISDIRVIYDKRRAMPPSGNGPAACTPDAGLCCTPNGSPGCEDAGCCAAICGADPFCCDTEWDGICAGAAAAAPECAGTSDCLAAGDCGTAAAGSCCDGAGNGSANCDDADCCLAVCAVDPFCCDVSWDGACAAQAQNDFPNECACPVDVACDPDKTPENEADCGLPTDTTNGGCNSAPVVTTPIAAGESYCGTSAFDGGSRDTDWYEHTVACPDKGNALVTWTVTAGFAHAAAIIDGVCPPAILSDFLTGPGGTTLEATALVSNGTTVRLFTAADFLDLVPCGAEYNATLTVDCLGPPECGNGVQEPGEECDGAMAGDCFGFPCAADCTCDIPECTPDFVVAAPGLFPGDTSGATDQCFLNTGGEHIYEVTLPNDGFWTFSTCNDAGGEPGSAGYDTWLDIGTTCCGTELASVDDTGGCDGFSTEVDLQLAAGVYYVMVEGFGTATGAYELSITKGPGPCEDPAAGNCCTDTGSPGCFEDQGGQNQACCESVCAADPFCCDVAWDAICAEAAIADPNCNCVVECGNGIVEPGEQCDPPDGVSCDDNCQLIICGPAAGPCDVPNGSPGCDNVPCCEAICAADGFCCDIEWDQICADAAAAEPICLGPPNSCCDASAPGGACTDFVQEADCIGENLEYFEGLSCAEVEAQGLCNELTGSCCEVGVACTTDVPASQCGGASRNYDSGDLGLPLPDGDQAGISVIINVPDTGTISDLNVGLNVTHTFQGDLCATLTAPGGAVSAEIIQRPGADDGSGTCHLDAPFGCAEDNYVGLVLDDQGVNGAIEGACAMNLGGSHTPFNPLSVFNGLEKQGDWTLTISDNAGADTGALDSWSLSIDNAEDQAEFIFTPGGDCSDECPLCGNGVVDAGEDCDPAGAELMVNAGFDENGGSLDGWGFFGTASINTDESNSAPASAQTVEGAGFSGVVQRFAASEGDSFSMSAWAFVGEGGLAADTFLDLKMEFCSNPPEEGFCAEVGNAIIGTVTAGDAAGVWTQYSGDAVAPAGTAHVGAVAVYVDTLGGPDVGGTVLVDDFSLTANDIPGDEACCDEATCTYLVSECRASTGDCDPAEFCDGMSSDCPADVLSTDVCRPAAGICDVAESCDGQNSDCPADGVAEAGTQCRASTGACDPAEDCDGSGVDCPADVTIVDNIPGDGCCLPGANANDDSDCVPVCGNGRTEPGEGCDDGNLDNGDGCDEFCQNEAPPVPTVTQWGMIAMILVLLAAMIAKFGRRRMTA